MPPPRPLTATPAPRLDFSRDGIPAATDFDDIYFSVDGGLDETRDVYLRACGLPERWTDCARFTIGELGFGTGLNVLAAWQLWDQTQDARTNPNARLHIVSYEGFPLSRQDLSKALSAWPELSDYAARLLALWPGRVYGVHRLHLSSAVTLTLVHDEIEAGLSALEYKANAWFLDGFSPAKNPDMWTQPVMAAVAARSARGARIGTFTVAGSVRRALIDAGFFVTKQPGFGRKRERLEAIYPGDDAAQSSAPTRDAPIILGAGIAGASIAAACLRRGITPIIITDDPDYSRAASGNAAALVKPRLDKQDRAESRFFLASYLYAQRQYTRPLQCGAWQIPPHEKDAARFKAIAENAPLPPAHMEWKDAPSAGAALGFETPRGALFFPQSPVIDPVQTCRALMNGAEIRSGAVSHITREESQWQLWDGSTLLAQSQQVFIANGAGIADLLDMDMRYSRGQISWARTAQMPAIGYGGYAVRLGEDTLIGATHSRLDGADPYALRPEDDAQNKDKFTALTGLDSGASERASRASIRVTTDDTLPRLHSAEGLSVLTGLGSRGFVFAPLLGEQLVAEWLGDVPAICMQTKARFTARETPTVKRAAPQTSPQ